MKDPKPYIAEYGGKAGGYFFLRDVGGFEENLLPCVYLPEDQDFESIQDKFSMEFKPHVVRASHPNDFWGLVDTLKTFEGTKHIYNLETEIELIREKANLPEIFDYNKYEKEFFGDKPEWQDYDGKIGIMIQPQNSGLRGSMVEHPHERDTYLVDFVWQDIMGDRNIESFFVKDNVVNFRRKTVSPPSDEVVMKVVELYKRVRETGFTPKDYSFQMEFGINEKKFPDKGDVLFYQARAFRKFEEPTFKVEDSVRTKKYSCFGITPPEGIELPVVKSYHQEGVNDIKEPFAWVIQNMMRPMSAHCRPRNMKAFLPAGMRVDNLE